MSPARGSTQLYIKLEERLVLQAWLNGLFGYQSNRDLLADMKEAAEGFDASGRSLIFHRLMARGDKVKIAAADLARYDDNICAHLHAINTRRPEPITLRYFQRLAALYSEVYLDRYSNRRADLLRSLNAFVAERNARRLAGEPRDAEVLESDLKKLAFWMATGSGKTLIMHLNYRQFLRYNTQPLDNILLITPNEGLSEQHLAEMADSGLPARKFDLNESGLGMAEKHVVRVIEITKLVQEKRGGGVSVPVDMSLKVQAMESRGIGIAAFEAHAGHELPIPQESLHLVDWECAYLDLLEYQGAKRPDQPGDSAGGTENNYHDNHACEALPACDRRSHGQAGVLWRGGAATGGGHEHPAEIRGPFLSGAPRTVEIESHALQGA